MSAINLSFDIIGDSGNNLVILHGLFGMGRNWAGIARALVKDHRVLIVDLRNHGASPWADEMTYEAMAADVAHLINNHCDGKADIIGHSMGGKTAMTLALTEPRLVGRTAIVDIAPALYDHDYESHVEAMASLDVSGLSRRGEAETVLLDVLDDPFLVRFLIRNLKSDPNGHGFKWSVNLDALARHMDDILDFPIFDSGQAFEGRVLFLAGGKSDYIQPYHQAEIERLFPQAQIEVIANASHWAHVDRPEEVVRVLESFLA